MEESTNSSQTAWKTIVKMIQELNRLLPLMGIGVASCALMKTMEAGWPWSAAFNGLFLGYCVALARSMMK